MATAAVIHLPVPPQGLPDSSQTASRLLQENHEKHHMFFNGEGFHNHISHALLTLWSLGASAAAIQKSYDLNKIFQRPQIPSGPLVYQDLLHEDTFVGCMSDDKNYTTFLDFFVREISSSGWQPVLQKYVFAGDKRADAMLVRLFDSFLHPLIHLGFGVEFEQPAIIAEALAQTACHQGWIAELLLPAEAASKTASSPATSQVALLDAFQHNEVIRQAPHWTDHDKIREGVLARSCDTMIQHLAQVKVDPTDVAAKTAEMFNAAAYLTAGAQRSGKAVKFDFYLLHCLTAATFFSTFKDQTWLSEPNKARLLEAKMRMDLVMYASRKSPALHLESIRGYKPKRSSDWDEIRARVCLLPDDGHACKVVRAIEHARDVCRPYQASVAHRLKDSDWHQLALMAIDSVEIEGRDEDASVQFDGPGEAWVRSAGFDEAWEAVADL